MCNHAACHFKRNNLIIEFNSSNLASNYQELRNPLKLYNNLEKDKMNKFFVEFNLSEENIHIKERLQTLLDERLIYSFNPKPTGFAYTLVAKGQNFFITDPFSDLLITKDPKSEAGAADWKAFTDLKSRKPAQGYLITFDSASKTFLEIPTFRTRNNKRRDNNPRQTTGSNIDLSKLANFSTVINENPLSQYDPAVHANLSEFLSNLTNNDGQPMRLNAPTIKTITDYFFNPSCGTENLDKNTVDAILASYRNKVSFSSPIKVNNRSPIMPIPPPLLAQPTPRSNAVNAIIKSMENSPPYDPTDPMAGQELENAMDWLIIKNNPTSRDKIFFMKFFNFPDTRRLATTPEKEPETLKNYQQNGKLFLNFLGLATMKTTTPQSQYRTHPLLLALTQ